MKPLTFETTMGLYQYSVNPENEDAIFVTSTKDLLTQLLFSLELAGTEEGRYFEDYEITATEIPYEFQIELTRADFCLFINFEVLNYV